MVLASGARLFSYVVSKDALDTLSYGMTAPSSVSVCGNCGGGEFSSLGYVTSGTTLSFSLTDVTVGGTWSSESTHAQISAVSSTEWVISWDDAGGDGDFNDLVTVVTANPVPPTITSPVGGPVGNQGPGNASENPTQCQSSRPVNCASGDFWHTFTDAAIPGRGLPLSFTRTYESASAPQDGIFGFGWSSSFAMSAAAAVDGTVTVMQENGSPVAFTPNGTGFTAPPRVFATLAATPGGGWTFTRRKTQVYLFGSNGRLTSEHDLNGETTSLGYDAQGKLTTVTDPAGRVLTLAYNATPKVASLTDPAGRVTTYGYNAAGELTDVTDPANGVWHFGYDSAHRMTTMTDPNGGATTNVYDSTSRVTSQTDPASRTTGYAYTGTPFTASGGTTTVTDPRGNVVVQQYVNGELMSVVKGSGTPQAATWQYRYDPATLGRNLVVDPNGEATTATFDADGNITSTLDPLGRSTTTTYNGLNEPTAVTDRSGVTTTNSYDAHGNPTSVSRPLTGSGQTQTTTYQHGDATHPGDVTAMIDPTNHTWSYEFNADGDRTKLTDPTGNITTATYNQDGEQTTSISGRGKTTTYVHDPLGELTKVTDPLSHVTSYGYDPNRNRNSMTDPKGNITTYGYNADDQLIHVHRADATDLNYTYDGDGNRTSFSNGATNVTTYTYDPLNRLASQADPLTRTTSYGYDPAGNRTTTTDAASRITTFGFDLANQLKSVDYSDPATPDVSYTYFPSGLRKTMTDGTGTTSYVYDSLNRLTSDTNGSSQTVAHTYDLADRVTAITYPNTKTVTRSYDTAGRLTSVTDWLTHTTTFGYDADGVLVSEQYPNGVTTTIARGDADAVTSMTDSAGATTLASFAYTRDANSQVTGETSTGTGQTAQAYTYNGLNHLTSRNTNPVTYNSADDVTGLDTATTVTNNAADEATSSTNAGQTTALTYNSSGDRLNGLTSDGQRATFSYDQASRLVQDTRPAAAPMVSAGANYTLAIQPGGQLTAWGFNSAGQLGDGTTTNRSVPITVPGLTGVTTIAAGGNHSLAVTSNGTVWSWGSNVSGALGNGTTVNKSSPIQVPGAAGATAVAAGNALSLALMPDGTVKAWGANAYGQVGDGTTTDRTSPVTVPGLTGVVAITAGADYAVVLKSDSTVWAWGHNNDGQLGDGTTVDRHAPVRCGAMNGIVAIDSAPNGNHTLALKNTGIVRAWGLNGDGQLGDNTTINRSTPVTVTGLSNMVAIAGGQNHSLAVQADGSVWAWGDNDNGQLGDNTIIDRHLPVQTQSMVSSDAITAGGNHSIAVKTDGTVWAWGLGTSGQLGNNTVVSSNTPVHVQGITNPDSAAAITSYSYDGDGLRAAVTSGSTTHQFAWDHTTGAAALLTDGTNSYLTGPDGTAMEQISTTGTVTYLHADQYGSTRLLTDSTGAITATYNYSAYGQLLSSTGTNNTPLHWGGQYQDADTGLYYLRARYYDPVTGQFLTVDPAVSITGQSYGYANEDPINGSDPTGLGGCGILAGVCNTATQAWNDTGGEAVHYVATHPKEAIGIGLGVVAVATGGTGLIVEGALATTILSATAVGTGLGASALDVGACRSGSTVACYGAGLGFIGSLAGGGPLWASIGGVADESLAGSLLTGLLGGFSLNFGAAGLTWDISTVIVNLLNSPSCETR